MCPSFQATTSRAETCLHVVLHSLCSYVLSCPKPQASNGTAEASWNEEILLVDEVDVFFGKNFYGRTHPQVAMLETPDAEELLREVWKRKDKAAQRQQVLKEILQCAPYKALLQKFPDFAYLVRSETEQMCADLKDQMAKKEKDYVFDEERISIGYRVDDGVAFGAVDGYKTAFDYLQIASEKPVPPDKLRKALAMRIPCGRFSYAKLGSAKILGVSGTVERLNDYEWQVMREFHINSYTVVPSVYGQNNFRFLNQSEGKPIIIVKDDKEHFYEIASEANT